MKINLVAGIGGFVLLLMAGWPGSTTLLNAQSCTGSATFTVNIGNVPAQPTTIAGTTAPCLETQAYSVTNTGGVSYNWSVTGGTIASGQGTNSVSVNWTGSGAQTLSVTPSNACGNGTLRSSPVTVNTVPVQPSAITGTAFACTEDVVASYSVTNVSGVTYSWSVSGGGTVTPSGNSASVDWNTAGSYVLTVVPSNTCGNGTSRTLNVTVETTPVPVINGVADACATVQQTYTVPLTSGNTYTWTVSANGTIISGQGTNSIVVQWNSGTTGTVSVTETNN